jgi:PKD repeat protein
MRSFVGPTLLAGTHESRRGRTGRDRRPIGAILMTLCLVSTLAAPATAAAAVTAVPALWTAGGLSAGNDSDGQAARVAVDASGNVAIVSGPAFARDLAVTSYTASGSFRWRATVSPSVGTFVGDWVAAAPDGDFVAVGRNTDSHGSPIGISLVRFGSDGALQWRVDLGGWRPGVARLLVDTAGNAYLAFNSIGDGQDIQVHKYDPAGALLWATGISTGSMSNDIATSLAFSPDQTEVVVTGDVAGGATWITALYDTSTGTRKWLVNAPEGTAALDAVVDGSRVYVTGQGSVGITSYLTVVAYDRATGARLWRTDKKAADSTGAAGLRMARSPDGSLVVAGQAARGFLDWYTVVFETSGAVRWEAVRDGGLNTDEIPRGVLVLADGTTVVTGPGGPNLPGGYIQGVTAGYSPNGTLLWEAFSKLATVWATALPNGDVCATGGYDALITCWRLTGVGPNRPPSAVMSATPASGDAPLTVNFDGSGSTDPDGTISSWSWSFGDGTSGTGAVISHVYTTPGMTHTATLTVRDSGGAPGTTSRTIVVNAAPAPAAPSGLTAALAGPYVALSWQDNSLNETAFHVERCEGSGCTGFAALGTQMANVRTYTDSSAAAGRSFSYRVRASNSGGYSGYSNVTSIVTPLPPPQPANLTATTLTRSSITLRWTNGVGDQLWIRIERCTGSGCTSFVQVAAVVGTATTYTDSGLAARTTYVYRVRASNAIGDSPYSNTASARTKR